MSIVLAQSCRTGDTLNVDGTGAFGAVCGGSTFCWPFEVEAEPFPPVYRLQQRTFGEETESVLVRLDIYPPLPVGVDICDVTGVPASIVFSDDGDLNFVPPPTPGTFHACASQRNETSTAVALRVGVCNADPLFPLCSVSLPSEDDYSTFSFCNVLFQKQEEEEEDDSGGGSNTGAIVAAVLIPICCLLCFPCLVIAFIGLFSFIALIIFVFFIIFIIIIICGIICALLPIVILVVVVIVIVVITVLLWRAFCVSKQTVQVVTNNSNTNTANPVVTQTNAAATGGGNRQYTNPPPPPPMNPPVVGSRSRMSALQTYVATSASELSLSKGTTVTCLEERPDGWSLCELDEGSSGWAPTSIFTRMQN